MQSLAREQHASVRQLPVEFAHFARSCWLGIIPASNSLLAFTKIVNRISFSFYDGPCSELSSLSIRIYLLDERASRNGHPAARKIEK